MTYAPSKDQLFEAYRSGVSTDRYIALLQENYDHNAAIEIAKNEVVEPTVAIQNVDKPINRFGASGRRIGTFLNARLIDGATHEEAINLAQAVPLYSTEKAV